MLVQCLSLPSLSPPPLPLPLPRPLPPRNLAPSPLSTPTHPASTAPPPPPKRPAPPGPRLAGPAGCRRHGDGAGGSASQVCGAGLIPGRARQVRRVRLWQRHVHAAQGAGRQQQQQPHQRQQPGRPLGWEQPPSRCPAAAGGSTLYHLRRTLFESVPVACASTPQWWDAARRTCGSAPPLHKMCCDRGWRPQPASTACRTTREGAAPACWVAGPCVSFYGMPALTYLHRMRASHAD